MYREHDPRYRVPVEVRVDSFTTPGARRVLLVVALALALLVGAAPAAPAASGGAGGELESTSGASAFDRQGMWIWYVSRSDGGDPASIIARADRYGIGTVYVKAGDGGGVWGQFNRPLVEALHAGGLDVCAWQFVYGDAPVAEAKVGATAVRRGADCLVIDAEAQYEGKYAAAERYLLALRARIGESFPLSLAGFPYVDYHPAFPYSVFFGPGGAQYNQPQMYWKAIGTSVRAVYEHTYLFNRLWGVPIYPLGQTWEAPGRAAIIRFRRFAESYGGQAPSWWDWQETSGGTWPALAAEIPGPIVGYQPIESQPILRLRSRGDLVVWAQEHLQAAGQTEVPISGIFGRATRSAVREFQEAKGLRGNGVIDTATWQALLEVEPVSPRWAARRTKRGPASASRVLMPRRPLSASLPAKGYEINPGPAP